MTFLVFGFRAAPSWADMEASSDEKKADEQQSGDGVEADRSMSRTDR